MHRKSAGWWPSVLIFSQASATLLELGSILVHGVSWTDAVFQVPILKKKDGLKELSFTLSFTFPLAQVWSYLPSLPAWELTQSLFPDPWDPRSEWQLLIWFLWVSTSFPTLGDSIYFFWSLYDIPTIFLFVLKEDSAWPLTTMLPKFEADSIIHHLYIWPCGLLSD